jgi:anti-anti-sigma factor
MMAFSAKLEKTADTAVITLAGELDTAAAMVFKDDVEQATVDHPKRLVLMLQDLSYIASAGLRVLVFAKQKMGPQVDIYVIAAQEQVLDTLQKTGFDRGCIVQDVYA